MTAPPRMKCRVRQTMTAAAPALQTAGARRPRRSRGGRCRGASPAGRPIPRRLLRQQDDPAPPPPPASRPRAASSAGRPTPRRPLRRQA